MGDFILYNSSADILIPVWVDISGEPAVNIWPILVATVVNQGLGMFWYSPSGFGKQWMASMGMVWPTDKKKQEAMKKKGKKDMSRGIMFSFIGNILLGIVFSLLLSHTTFMGAMGGAHLALLCWLGFTLTRGTLQAVVWEGRPWSYYAINVGQGIDVQIITPIQYEQ